MYVFETNLANLVALRISRAFTCLKYADYAVRQLHSDWAELDLPKDEYF